MRYSAEADAVLRAKGAYAIDARVVPWRMLCVIVAVSGATHGAMMGAFNGLGPQLFLSALKTPFLIVASTLLSLPALFAVNTVLGLRDSFGAVVRGILGAQATVAVALHALGPLLLFVYASTDDYETAKIANGVLFLVASIAGQITLGVHYRPLIARDGRHRVCRRVWWFLYAFVTIQMAWVLRPFIGSPDMEFQLFREDAWGNAFVELLALLARFVEG